MNIFRKQPDLISMHLIGESREINNVNERNDVPPPLFARMVCEFLGTCLFIFFGAGCAAKSTDLLTVSAAHGISALWLVYMFGPISGGHFNAGATIVFSIHERMRFVETLGYLGAQALGSLFSGALLLWLYGTSSSLGTPALKNPDSLMHGFAIEFVCTIILSFVLFFTKTYTSQKEGALVVGSVVFSSFLLGGDVDGAALNPWRWLGPAVASRSFKQQAWIYSAGPIAGFIVGYVVFLLYRSICKGKLHFRD